MSRHLRTANLLDQAQQRPRRILIVEDDRDVAELVARKLSYEGYATTTALGVREALRVMANGPLPDLAIVDIRLPDGSGLDFCRSVQQTSDLPIILVTAVDDSATIVEALLRVAEDYVVKPFNLAELAARVHRVLRRLHHDASARAESNLGGSVTVNFYTRTLTRGLQSVELTPTESKLLNVLMAHQGAIVPFRFLLQRVWPMQEAVDETLRVHMSRLRRKLELADPDAHYIETERAVGYRFVRQVRPAGCGPSASEPISTAARATDDCTVRSQLPNCQNA